MCDANVKKVTLKPLPHKYHGDTHSQAIAAAGFLSRLQLLPQAAATTAVRSSASNGASGSSDGGSTSRPADHGDREAARARLSLCFDRFTPDKLAAWLQGPLCSVQPLMAVEKFVFKQAVPRVKPLLDSSLLRLAELVVVRLLAPGSCGGVGGDGSPAAAAPRRRETWRRGWLIACSTWTSHAWA